MNENFMDRAGTGLGVPPAPEQIAAPPRRGQHPGPGYGTPPEYAAEVFAMPATIPGPGFPEAEEMVDFDRMIEDESIVDFDRLARQEADAAFEPILAPPSVLRPEATFPPAVRSMLSPAPAAANPLLDAAGAGGLDGFGVYGDPEPGANAPGRPPAPADPSRDVGVTEKPDFYEDPSSKEVTHSVRLTPGRTLSLGKKRVFRVDSRGIPIFSPGYDAGMAAGHFQRSFLILTSVGLLFAGLAAAMVYLAVGADSNYLKVRDQGTLVEATVADVTSAVKADSAKKTDSVGATTTATAAVKFTLDGKVYTRNISDTSTSSTAMLGAEKAWEPGEKLRLYVDLDRTGQVIPVDDAQPDRYNPISLSPLLLAAAFAGGGISAARSAGKMREISIAER